jgi:hypothetical protein
VFLNVHIYFNPLFIRRNFSNILTRSIEWNAPKKITEKYRKTNEAHKMTSLWPTKSWVPFPPAFSKNSLIFIPIPMRANVLGDYFSCCRCRHFFGGFVRKEEEAASLLASSPRGGHFLFFASSYSSLLFF